MKLLTFVLALLTVVGMELTPENWDAETAGKKVFLKFLAPWWGHCKKLKPTWDRLIKEFEKSETSLVADVDCTAGGKDLCQKFEIKSYPTLKYGNPSDLQDYKSKRDYDSLLEFAKENLGPTCGPEHMELCDEEMKAKVISIQTKGLEKLELEISELDDVIKTAEEYFETEVKKLQAKYENLEKEKAEAIKAAKDQDLGLLKSVRNYLQQTAVEHEEL